MYISSFKLLFNYFIFIFTFVIMKIGFLGGSILTCVCCLIAIIFLFYLHTFVSKDSKYYLLHFYVLIFFPLLCSPAKTRETVMSNKIDLFLHILIKNEAQILKVRSSNSVPHNMS